jgi:MFS family permease
MASFTGAPLGGFVGGLIVSLLLGRGFDWPVIFIRGGALPLILLPILALWLPESPRFLARKSNSTRQPGPVDVQWGEFVDPKNNAGGRCSRRSHKPLQPPQ